MKVESRKRGNKDGTSYHDIVLISENEEESKILDLLGDRVDADGIIENGEYELRLSDGYGEHYVLLKSNQKGK